MNSKNIKVSIIIVHYSVEKELMACISSILKSKLKESYEIIVVDNDEVPKIEKKLKEKFKEVRYIKSSKNLGFGGGNNLGALHAQGKFLFFLNPDTEVFPKTIDILYQFLRKEKSAGIAAPLLFGTDGKPYQQGSKNLGVLQGIVVLSFLNKLFPNNYVSKRYLLNNWDKKNIQETEVVPGTAFMIKRNIFEEVKGFDENFFLYFEEFDLCKRIRKLGYKFFILPRAKVKHIWGASTKKSDINLNKVFSESRFYYFKKHYGFFPAVLVQAITGLSIIHVFIAAIIIFSAFLRLNKLQELMLFIGDQGWFYLSARDMIITGDIPLVGIPSSHPWIHQGPLWTYMLAIALSIGNFNPISGSYLTTMLGVITVWVVYKIGLLLFSRRTGLIAAALYATSPLVVINSRMAYHTSPIPLFTLLFIWSLLKWIRGDSLYFPFAIFFLAILYNLELAASVMWLVLGLTAGYGIWKRKSWAMAMLTKKIISFSLFAFLIPMIPIIIYDLQHGFPQTVKFAAWIGYRVLGFLGIITGSSFTDKSSEMISFFANQYKFLIFFQNRFLSFLIFILSMGWFVKTIYKSIAKRKYQVGTTILLLWVLIPIAVFFGNKTPSDAYMPILFPAVILITALSFESLMRVKTLRVLTIAAISFIVLINVYTLLSNKYFAQPAFSERVNAAQKIVDYANGKKYAMVGEGVGSEFESFTMNYEYLTWWLGHGVSKDNIDIVVVISESANGINIRTVNK